MEIKMIQGEYWYGGPVHSSFKQPIGEEDVLEVDLRSNLYTESIRSVFCFE